MVKTANPMQRFRNSFRRSSICRRTYRRKTDRPHSQTSFYNKNGVLEVFEDDPENSAKLERNRYDSLPDIALTDEFQERKKLMKRAFTISQGDNVFASRHVSDKSSNVAEKDQFCWTSVFGTANSLAPPPQPRSKFTTFQTPTKINTFYELSSDVNSSFSGRLPADMKLLTESDYQRLLVPQKKPPKISFNDQTDFTKTFFVTDLEDENSSDDDHQKKIKKKETIFWNDMSISHKLIEIDVKGIKIESVFTKL